MDVYANNVHEAATSAPRVLLCGEYHPTNGQPNPCTYSLIPNIMRRNAVPGDYSASAFTPRPNDYASHNSFRHLD